MDNEKYRKRIIEELKNKKLRTSGAVLVTGPKYCGKTTTCMMMAKSEHSFSTKGQIQLYGINIKRALVGETPVLIDEWQNIPEIWDEVRDEVDKRNEFGQFLFTGSVQPANYDEIIHSGEGRFSRVVMFPFSLYESGDSNGLVSINDLFENPDKDYFDLNDRITLDDIAYLICRGGWPTSLMVDKEDSLEISYNYYEGLINYKSRDEKNYFNNRKYAELIIRSFARNISSEAAYTTILSDIKKSDNTSIDDETLTSYIQKLENLFVLMDLDAWNPNLRSKTAIRTTPTRHFVDTSIATASLGISPNDLINDTNTMGLFFEDMVIRDLRIYTQGLKANLYHYRDKAGLECDAVIHMKNGNWAALEVKLGGENLINEGLESLRKIKNKIDYSRFKEPSFLAVITACGPLYKTKDGIFVIPINMLKQ